MKHFNLILLAPLILILMAWVGSGLTIDVDSEEAQYLEEQNEILYYRDDLFTGELVKYFDNGELVFRRAYKDGKKHGVWEKYHKNGQLSNRKIFKNGEKNGFWQGYYENGQLRYKGMYIDGEKYGVWEEYFENGQPLVVFDYGMPAALRTPGREEPAVDEPLDFPRTQEQAEVELETPFRMTDTMPDPPGGMRGFYEYIYDHMTYPAKARKKEIQGVVYVQFVVQPDGSLSDVQAMRGPGGGLNEEAVRVIKGYPKKWKPGTQDGKAVPVYYNLPIKFTLQ